MDNPPIKMWLDDVRDPVDYGRIGWVWVKNYDEAIALLNSGCVIEASLDHDLSHMSTIGMPCNEKTGYDVVCYMEEHNIWPKNGTAVHSMNPSGAARMRMVISRAASGTS